MLALLSKIKEIVGLNHVLVGVDFPRYQSLSIRTRLSNSSSSRSSQSSYLVSLQENRADKERWPDQETPATPFPHPDIPILAWRTMTRTPKESFYPAYLLNKPPQKCLNRFAHPGTGQITAETIFAMTSDLASSSEGWSRNRVLWLCGQKIDGMNTISRVLDDWNLVFHGCWNCGHEHEVVDVPAC